MKIAYVSSGLNMTFVVNDMETHRKAGWDVLPLASCKPHKKGAFSPLMRAWNARAVFRPDCLTMAYAMVCQIIRHPLRFCRICNWLAGFAASDLVGFFKAVYELPAACCFAAHCRRFGVQHVHVHFASRSLSLGIMISMLISSPVSCTVHAFDIYIRSSRNLIPKLSQCIFIAAISNYTIEYLRDHCGERIADLCHVIHCGVDLDTFKTVSRTTEPGRFLCVANLVAKKGHAIAIRACARLNAAGCDVRFDIVGEGPLRDRLQRLVASLNLEGVVRFHGAVANDKLAPLLSGACALVLPSVIEPCGDRDGIPVAMIEAMACEVPVISTWVSGIPELVRHGENGLLVHERDVEGLAEAMMLLMNDPEMTIRLGRAARIHVERHFDIDKTAARLRTLILEASGGVQPTSSQCKEME